MSINIRNSWDWSSTPLSIPTFFWCWVAAMTFKNKMMRLPNDASLYASSRVHLPNWNNATYQILYRNTKKYHKIKYKQFLSYKINLNPPTRGLSFTNNYKTDDWLLNTNNCEIKSKLRIKNQLLTCCFRILMIVMKKLSHLILAL